MIAAALKYVETAGLRAGDMQDFPEFTATGLSLPMVMLDAVSSFVLPLFIIILIGFMISEEYGQGTLSISLIHPVTRGKLLLSKLITVEIVAVILLIFTFVISFVIGTLFFGVGQEVAVTSLIYGKVAYPVASGLMLTLQSYTLTAITMIAFTSLVILLAIQFSSSGAMIGAGIGILIVLTALSNIPAKFNQYFITGYLKFHNIIFYGSPAVKPVFGVLVLAIYAIAAYVISCSVFKKKDILY